MLTGKEDSFLVGENETDGAARLSSGQTKEVRNKAEETSHTVNPISVPISHHTRF